MSAGNKSIRNPFHLLHKDGRRCIAVVLSCLMLAAVLFGSLHHHDDEKDHSDCSICAVANHNTAHSIVTVFYNPPIPEVRLLASTPYIRSFTSSTRPTPLSRGPPA
jgi:hypothetical protein